jgi:hypothetical protein
MTAIMSTRIAPCLPVAETGSCRQNWYSQDFVGACQYLAPCPVFSYFTTTTTNPMLREFADFFKDVESLRMR